MNVDKKLIINGKEYLVSCPETDTLVKTIRATGLTGAKIGCGTGVCGACSVILNGELVRACVKRMKAIPDGSEILTIEGIGTPDNPHPLQKAWAIKGAAQCGFCSPGFIVSAYALLKENPSPSRDDVRAWFQKNKNLCRCTGYKPIVDAVMLAAEVMRGDRPQSDLDFSIPEDGHIMNTGYPRPTAMDKACGVTEFGDDIAVKKDFLEAAIVMAEVYHANILSIDTSEAEKAEGVVKVITAQDIEELGGSNRLMFPFGDDHSQCDGDEQPVLCDEKVFRYGDAIALVVADTREHARAAAKLVKPEYEILPEYHSNPLDALAPDAIEVHPDIPNDYWHFPIHKGTDTREIIPESAFSVEGSFYSGREPHLCIEPDVGQAYIDEEGVLTVFNKTHMLPMFPWFGGGAVGWYDDIRVILNPPGGAFGYSLSISSNALVALATIAVDGKPVNLTLDYREHQHYTGKRAASFSNGKLACDKDGKLTGLEFEIAFDKGAYSDTSNIIEKGIQFFGAPYYIPNIMGQAVTFFSNSNYSTAYRGFGAPQAYTGSEALIDMLAEKAGIDPFEFRYINVMREGQTGNCGNTYSVYPMADLMDMARPKYEEMKAAAAAASTPEKRRGIGVSIGHYNVGPGPGDHSDAEVELMPDGTVTSYNQWQDLGQGGDIGTLTHTHEALKPLGLTPDQIHLVMNDTATCPISGASGGSRQNYMTGNAIKDACDQLLDAMRKEDGTYRTYDEMIAEGIDTRYLGSHDSSDYTSALDSNTGQGSQAAEYTYMVYLADVEVDTKTGKARVLEMHAFADVGTVANYLAVDGQAYGGMMHSIGYALSEEFFDTKKYETMVGCGFPTIEDIPDGDKFTVTYLETPRPRGHCGCGGCSEGFQSGDHMAVINAINQACGVRIYELPALPEKILAGLKAKENGEEIKPARYDFGKDFYEVVDEMWANPVGATEGGFKC